MAQYYEVLGQGENTDQQFYSNVEDQTVQYVITPDKTQVQYPQQIVVTSGDQLMLVESQQQQIVLDRSPVAYQGQQIQQVQVQQQPIQIQQPQIQQQQYALIQDGDLSNGAAQQIFYMDANTNEGIVLEQQTQLAPQPVVLNHQLGQNNTVRVPLKPNNSHLAQQQRMVLRQPLQHPRPQNRPLQRPLVPNQMRQPNINQNPVRLNLLNRQTSQIRNANANVGQVGLRLGNPQTVRQASPIQQQFRPQNPVQNVNRQPQPRLNINAAAQKNQHSAIFEAMKAEEGEIVSLPDGSVVPSALYKKMIQSQKARAMQQQRREEGEIPQNQCKKRGGAVRGPRLPRANPRPCVPQFGQAHQPQQFQEVAMHVAQQQQQQRQPAQRQNQANFVIQPPRPNQKPAQQKSLPPCIASSQIQKIIENTPVSEEFTDSIRMLVLLENGEQRLITFTLPKEACTIQEILEQVNVPFRSDTNIQVTEANANGINYIVTVGDIPNLGCEQEGVPPAEGQQQNQVDCEAVALQPDCALPESGAFPEGDDSPKSESPELAKDLPSKYVPGMLALCGACGYLSENFTRCIRCQRALPDNVKSISATIRASSALRKEREAAQLGKSGSISKPVSPMIRKKRSSKIVEHDSVVISSDEEEEEMPSRVDNSILQKLGNSITISPITKEPSSNEIQRHNSDSFKSSSETEEEDVKFMSIDCRTVRIGSYRFNPPEKVLIDSKEMVIKVPHPMKEDDVRIIRIETCEIVKVLASFHKALPVYFYYLNPATAKYVREELDMTPDGLFYFDPLSVKDESYRRLTLLPEEVGEEDRNNFHLLYGSTAGMLDELSVTEANNILLKTCPKDTVLPKLPCEPKQLFTYPPEGRGRIAINTEDFVCLAQDQFLNDVIIDFYLKYLVDHLPEDMKPKIHVFSTFFYKRLTTKPTKASRRSQPAELDPSLTPSQKRHARVRTWTKSVNIFEKDFVIVPINENAHWFLAIICFPGMDGTQTWDGNPIKIEVKSRKKKTISIPNVGNVTVSVAKTEKEEVPIVCEDSAFSDKDEAEGDDSELDSDDSEEIPGLTPPSVPIPAPVRQPKEPRVPIKQPCILIFDSLPGASRSRVVATLRDYLTCEYKIKMGAERVFNKDVIKGACPKVPQQNNFTDCGLYLLQYVEQFFNDPIKDYHIPVSQIKNWFEELTVTRKREDIGNLIKSLMLKYGKDPRILPDIAFPTINGKLLELERSERSSEELEEGEMADEEMSTSNENNGNEFLENMAENENSESKEDAESLDLFSKPSCESESDFVAKSLVNPKPDIGEFPRQTTNRDTLSYLKAKRIIRHKNSDGPDSKKQKSEQSQ